MPFTDIELKYIENNVGKMCKRRSPPHLHNQLRTVYEVRGLDVVVYEERPAWRNPKELSRTEVAKFKYSRKNGEWKLYWMRSDLKWHSYDMTGPTRRLEELVKEVDEDPDGAFFG